jgi:hypothetical protein
VHWCRKVKKGGTKCNDTDKSPILLHAK